MFKMFFKNIGTSIKNKIQKVKKSKIVRAIRKVLKYGCYGTMLVTAFNLGNIQEALGHMVDGPTTFKDTVNWLVVLCTSMVNDLKAKNITWEIKRIFFPAVTAVAYIGTKLLKGIRKGFNWISSITKVMKKSNIQQKPVEKIEAVNPFA